MDPQRASTGAAAVVMTRLRLRALPVLGQVGFEEIQRESIGVAPPLRRLAPELVVAEAVAAVWSSECCLDIARRHWSHGQLLEPGYKYDMTDVQASVGLHQLPQLEGFLGTRERHGMRPATTSTRRRTGDIDVGRRPYARHLYIIPLRLEELFGNKRRVHRDVARRGNQHRNPLHLAAPATVLSAGHGLLPDSLPVARDIVNH